MIRIGGNPLTYIFRVRLGDLHLFAWLNVRGVASDLVVTFELWSVVTNVVLMIMLSDLTCYMADKVEKSCLCRIYFKETCMCV